MNCQFIRRNAEMIIVLVVSLVLAGQLSFIYYSGGNVINLYERISTIPVSLLGLLLASYAIFISFIRNLKKKTKSKTLLGSLNNYFIVGILLLLLLTLFHVVYPILGIQDFYWFRFLFIFTLGITLLIVRYLFLSAKKFIE